MAKKYADRMRKVDKHLSQDAQDMLKRDRVKLKKSPDPDKYSRAKAKEVNLYEGYDMLEHFLIARQYICKRYKIKIGLLEVLLHFAAPKNQFFSQKDWVLVPKQLAYSRLQPMLDKGFVSIQSEGANLAEHLFTLSNQGFAIVRGFYQYLSGERIMPERYTPQSKPDACAFDKKAFNFIQKVNSEPKNDKLKPLYS